MIYSYNVEYKLLRREPFVNGGAGRNRTGVHGVAGRSAPPNTSLYYQYVTWLFAQFKTRKIVQYKAI
jgi:hypothetical protein